MTHPPDRPPTRWSRTAHQHDYASRFAGLVEEGVDIVEEARLADALVPRDARILDVGSGMGRVAAALRAFGHDVVATEPDPALRAQSRATYPRLDVLRHLAGLLAPGGRILAGFHLLGGARGSRDYPPEEFIADVAASGLRVEHRFGSYDLGPADDEYAVWILSQA